MVNESCGGPVRTVQDEPAPRGAAGGDVDLLEAVGLGQLQCGDVQDAVAGPVLDHHVGCCAVGGGVAVHDHDPVPTGGTKAGKPTGEPLRIAPLQRRHLQARPVSGGLGGVVGLLDAGGELDVAGVRPPSVGLARTRVALVQRMSMSGWWPAASTAVATWLTKSSPLELV